MKSILVLTLALFSLPTLAETPEEKSVKAMLAPHIDYPGIGNKIAVNYVHHTAYTYGARNGPLDRASFDKDIRKWVTECIKERNRPMPPPAQFPDYFMLFRQDDYSAPNRRIKYNRGVAVKWLLEDDCVPRLSDIHHAFLASSAGLCKIDLIKKTAVGQCDVRQHETAKPMMIDKAALMSRSRKKVMGIECMNVIIAGVPLGCHTLGEFQGMTGNFEYGTVQLEGDRFQNLGLSKLEEVKLNMAVNASVFAPHMAAGFKVTNEPAPPPIDLKF